MKIEKNGKTFIDLKIKTSWSSKKKYWKNKKNKENKNLQTLTIKATERWYTYSIW